MLSAVPPQAVTEKELVCKAQKGSSTSFILLYRSYQAKVRGTLYRLSDQHHLDDLVQEVFLRVWQGLPKLREPSYFSTWLYRITCHVAADHRRGYRPCLSLDMPVVGEDTSHLNHLHYQDILRQGLAHLKLEQRMVLVLHDLEDLPIKEVAKILEVPEGTVKSRLFHARSALRRFLDTQGISL